MSAAKMNTLALRDAEIAVGYLAHIDGRPVEPAQRDAFTHGPASLRLAEACEKAIADWASTYES